MIEREQVLQKRVAVEVGAASINCYSGAWGNDFSRTINGVGVRVSLDGAPVWERREYPNFCSAFLGHPRKPFYEARIRRAKVKADKIAEKLKASL